MNASSTSSPCLLMYGDALNWHRGEGQGGTVSGSDETGARVWERKAVYGNDKRRTLVCSAAKSGLLP